MPVLGRLSKPVVKAPSVVAKAPRSKIQAPEKFQIPRSNRIESRFDIKRRGEDTAPYLVAETDLIRRGCVGRSANSMTARFVRENDEATRRDGLEKCR
jgi:hypothetical protein